MAALQVKQICMYLDLGDLPKIINAKEKIDFSQVLMYIYIYIHQKYMVPPKPFKKNIMIESAATVKKFKNTSGGCL